MGYFRKFLQNIAVLILVLVGMYVFMRVFYPETIEVFGGVAQFYTAFKLWPIMILALLIFLLPRRRR